jgi:hypothetical protein
MYELLTASAPELAEIVTETMLMSYRPFFVIEPNKRTCVCTYHNTMDMAVEDARNQHACGTLYGCNGHVERRLRVPQLHLAQTSGLLRFRVFTSIEKSRSRHLQDLRSAQILQTPNLRTPQQRSTTSIFGQPSNSSICRPPHGPP